MTIGDRKRRGLHPSFFEGPDYWYEKGKKIGAKVEKLLTEQGHLDYPVILPAERKSTTGDSWSDLIKRANNPEPSELVVRRDAGVVSGLLDYFEVDEFPDLDRSKKLQDLGYIAAVDPIFRADQYSDIEKHRVSGGLYLPGVRVDFEPITDQSTDPSDLI